MTKHQQIYQQMLEDNKELFNKFRRIHDLYVLDPKTNQAKYNQIGVEVQDIVRRYENRLCNSSESTGFGKFSTKLSEKFYHEVKSAFPKYYSIGLETN